MSKKNNKPKVLFYDIETTPLKAWIWRCGKQVVRHGQLVNENSQYDIICIGYEFLHGNKKGVLAWDYEKQCSKKMIKEFTKLCDEADIIIGKNNKRFDDKHVNTLRMIHGLDGRPDLLKKVDDLETQVRRHFYLPSYGLDYISNLAGLGGKDSMCMQDWIDIVEKNKNGKKSFKKMIKYCAKDVHDTKLIWKYCEKHIEPKLNVSALNHNHSCKVCGSLDIRKNGVYTSSTGGVFQQYYCNSHKGYAGKVSIKSKNPILRS